MRWPLLLCCLLVAGVDLLAADIRHIRDVEVVEYANEMISQGRPELAFKAWQLAFRVNSTPAFRCLISEGFQMV